jgi:hypothetical protein
MVCVFVFHYSFHSPTACPGYHGLCRVLYHLGTGAPGGAESRALARVAPMTRTACGTAEIAIRMGFASLSGWSCVLFFFFRLFVPI